jgi:N-carbamoylputrescine amidase
MSPTPWPRLCILSLTLSCAQPSQDVASFSLPQTIRVAVCQLAASDNLPDALLTIDRALTEADEQNAQLACFPETCLLGWVNPEARELAHSIPGPTTDRLGVLARKHGLMIAIGLAELENGHLYDTAVLIDSNGEILLRHRKVNILTELMAPPYTPGKDASLSVADTRFGRIGLLICADTFKDELVQEMATAKPDLVVVPYGWAAPQIQWPEHGKSMQAWVANTARKTSAPVVGVDAVGTIKHGPWTGYSYGGQSVVCDRSGESLGRLADRAPEIRVFEVDLAP